MRKNIIKKIFFIFTPSPLCPSASSTAADHDASSAVLLSGYSVVDDGGRVARLWGRGQWPGRGEGRGRRDVPVGT